MSDKLTSNNENLNVVAEQEEESSFSFRAIFDMLVLNWQWFLLSIFIFVCGALIYLRYASPVYQASVKMLIKDDDNRSYGRSNKMLANMQDFGFMSNSEGIENEVEILKSNILARDAVIDLKLYVEYRSVGRLTKPLIYKTQPVNADLEVDSLIQWDKDLLYGAKSISMSLTRKGSSYQVKGKTFYKGLQKGSFEKVLKSLPASIKTEYGVVTLTKNEPYTMEDGKEFLISIRPPMSVAYSYTNRLSVDPTSKMTTIAQLTVKDGHPLRAMDFLNQLATCYNRQANVDKNEIAVKTEEFINNRLEKIDAELGNTESTLQSYKQRHAVTQIQMDATQTLQMSSQYEGKLAEANAQIHLLDYLREFIDKPENTYKTIPSNVGMTDQASTMLIANYNKVVQDRNRLLKAASEQAPQVQALTSTLDDLQNSIRQALLQARRSADIMRQSAQNQYNKYQSKIGNTPEKERVLTQIGRQQEVKSGLYLLLLQKREENSISLAATANKGKLIDEPQFNGQVSPKKAIILLAALILGIALPFCVLYLLQLMRFRIEGRDDLVRLTQLPIVADIPVASDSVKDSAGIVVQANTNNQIDEIFRSLRTNIQFMMQEDDKVILFTSSISGEGKTFVAANLAVSFALLGKKVVLCGMDIRKPALGRLFNVADKQKGISTLLSKNKNTLSMADVEGQISASGVNENLDLLLAGPIPPNPTELLARENLKMVLDFLKQKYDYIILDTAPVGLVADTMQIAHYANVCCFMCRADYTPKSNLVMVNGLANSEKLKNLCIVLNGVDMSKKKYGYYYGYGRYGKYGRYGYARYGKYGYGTYGNYGNYGNYANSHYGNKEDNSIKK